MRWHGSASSKRGGSPKYSEVAIQFGLTSKSTFNLPLRPLRPLRPLMGMPQRLFRLAGLGWSVPGFSTVSWRQKHWE